MGRGPDERWAATYFVRLRDGDLDEREVSGTYDSDMPVDDICSALEALALGDDGVSAEMADMDYCGDVKR